MLIKFMVALFVATAMVFSGNAMAQTTPTSSSARWETEASSGVILGVDHTGLIFRAALGYVAIAGEGIAQGDEFTYLIRPLGVWVPVGSTFAIEVAPSVHRTADAPPTAGAYLRLQARLSKERAGLLLAVSRSFVPWSQRHEDWTTLSAGLRLSPGTITVAGLTTGVNVFLEGRADWRGDGLPILSAAPRVGLYARF